MNRPTDDMTTAKGRAGLSARLAPPQGFTSHIAAIAAAYDAAPLYDPRAAAGWRGLARDSVDRAAGIRLMVDVRETDDPEPYPDAFAMCEDIAAGRFVVSRANSEHPIWTVAENVAFRIVHDVLGHYAASVARVRPGLPFSAAGPLAWDTSRVAGFDWAGENAACLAHVRLLSHPGERAALFTECVAQTGFAIARGGFGPQKVADLRRALPSGPLATAYGQWSIGGAR